MSLIIFFLGVIYFLAHFLSHFFDKTRIPDVLILMVLGIVAGPVFHIVEPLDFGQVGQVMSSIALIIILFQSGTTLDIKVLASSLGSTMLISLITFGVTLGIITAITVFLLDFTLLTGLLAGSIMAGTSSAVVIPMVKGLKMSSKPSTILIIESAFTDVLCIVLTISFLGAAVSNEINSGQIAINILSSFGLAAFFGVLAGFIWLMILNEVRQLPNNLFTTFAYLFLIFGIVEFLGFSGAIASLAFGITLTNNRRNGFRIGKSFKVAGFAVVTETEKLVFSEMVFLLKTFFFIYLGVSLTFSDSRSLLVILLILVLVYLSRLLITRLTLSRKTLWREAAYTSVLIPKGLAAAILASLPLQAGIEGGEMIQSMAFYIVLISILMTAISIPLINNFKPVNGFYRSFFKKYAQDADTVEGSEGIIPFTITGEFNGNLSDEESGSNPDKT